MERFGRIVGKKDSPLNPPRGKLEAWLILKHGEKEKRKRCLRGLRGF
jgi:hypothetical protein